jgi:uncharacterized protein (DUF488 family)
MKVFTLGYQGSSLATYVEALTDASIDIVVDVRETPWSYKPGFSKAPLSNCLKNAGIDYVHIKSAGNPSKNRKTAKSMKECLARYRKHLAHHPQCLEELSELLLNAQKRKQNVCFTCFEKDAEECHRSIILEELSRRLKHVSAIHLLTETKALQPFAGTIVLQS